MLELTLKLLSTSDEGTFSLLGLDNGKVLYVAEPPWRNNQIGKSCLPAGYYDLNWHATPEFPEGVYCFDDEQTSPRTAERIHKGNFAGDVSKGLQSDSKGCLMVGLQYGKLENHAGNMQTAILYSEEAYKEFLDFTQMQPIRLLIDRGAPWPPVNE